jgi:hypothetical protein
VSVRKKRVRLFNHHTGDIGWISRDVFETLARKAIEQDRIAPRDEAVTSKQPAIMAREKPLQALLEAPVASTESPA